MARSTSTPAERFAAKTTPGPIPPGLTTPCQLWPEESLDRDGYGRFWADGRTHAAHRWGFEQTHGPIPPGLELDHLCSVRRCVADDHLDPVDHRTNVLRSTGPSAINARRTKCSNGHDLTNPANVHVAYPPSHPNGMRKCRPCNRDHTRRARVAALPTRTTPERTAA
ncbi:HNH endonuclease [Streptomyces sp. OfavH-34-F]|uniref:HNH endonuclease signature motif containing protein n=1 Tax=Streptomyces sp. OfavH-34-F TaxID=2917760 RepID=UPI001EF34448|nr:HNH endonuclease signature motif containing protein [Streptomyces sp. OfavH-34-F]MCG7524917.1 HNH endonuclease [Streptomyces sp. OfavH-34-F]